MLYKFKSKATGDVIMTGPVGDKVLRAMGREPAPQGIFEAAALASLLAALERSMAEEEARGGGEEQSGEDADVPGKALSLKQRAWPLLEMMKKAHTNGADIVWGV